MRWRGYALVIWMALVGAAQAEETAVAIGDVDTGERMFQTKCGSCQ